MTLPWLKRVLKVIFGLAAGLVLLYVTAYYWPVVLRDETYQRLQAITASPKQMRLIAYRDFNDDTVIDSKELSSDDSRRIADLFRSGRLFFPGYGQLLLKCEPGYKHAIEFVEPNGVSTRIMVDYYCLYFRVENQADEETPLPWRAPISEIFARYNLPLYHRND